MGFARKLWCKTQEHIFKKETVDACALTDEELLKQAHQELEDAYHVFTRAEEPDMIDYAVYNLKAAEKRYGYLLKRIRNQRN